MPNGNSILNFAWTLKTNIPILPILTGTFAHKIERPLSERSLFDTLNCLFYLDYMFKVKVSQPYLGWPFSPPTLSVAHNSRKSHHSSADFSETEREGEKEKERGETIKGPTP